MKHSSKIGLIIFLLAAQISLGQSDLERQLFELKDVIFTKIKTPDGYESAYELMIKQPLNHDNPNDGSFYQRVFLSHRDFSAPTILATEGYDRPRNRIYELTEYLHGNQFDVEHRYYGKSIPDSMDYTYLNLKQATSDCHRINEIIRSIYSGAVVSTGISKGGMTTLFYRYFYPDDVDVSVPYVAPINVDFKDKRIYQFLNEVGTAECRNDVAAFQGHLLKNKKEFLPLVKWYAKGQNNKFERLGIEGAYELAVLEYSFSFWQYGTACNAIPALDSDREEILDHFLSVSGVAFFCDESIDGYAPFYYQMGNEMGYYGYETKNFADYISVVGDEPSAVFWPDNVIATFEPSLTRKAQKWMTEELENVIYINGALDTWSATAISPKPGLDAHVFNIDGAHHASARIVNMSKEELQLLETTFENWLNIDVIYPREEILKKSE